MGCCFLHAHHDDCVGDVRVDGDGADHSDDDDGCDDCYQRDEADQNVRLHDGLLTQTIMMMVVMDVVSP